MIANPTRNGCSGSGCRQALSPHFNSSCHGYYLASWNYCHTQTQTSQGILHCHTKIRNETSFQKQNLARLTEPESWKAYIWILLVLSNMCHLRGTGGTKLWLKQWDTNRSCWILTDLVQVFRFFNQALPILKKCFLHFKQTDQYFYPPITFWLPEILTPSNHQWRQIRSIFIPICYSLLTLWSRRCSKYHLVLLEKTWTIQIHGLGLEKEKKRNWNEMRAEKWKTKKIQDFVTLNMFSKASSTDPCREMLSW